MFSGEIDPGSPGWLIQRYDIMRNLGLRPVTDNDNSGDQYARQTEAVGMDYLRLYFTDPDRALESMGNYLDRFSDINRSSGILSRTTPDQFGMVANIASLHYTSFGRGRQISLHRQIDKYLSGKNSANVPGYTAQLRKPELIRDLVVHWSSINWPTTGDYSRFLANTADWGAVQQHIELGENNPVMFALTVPLSTTDPIVRLRFRDRYPELTQQGIDIIAARLFNRGAHDEILRAEGSTQELKQWYEKHYKGWEDSIDDNLTKYASEYKFDILNAIVNRKWNIFPEVEGISFPGMVDKLTHTSFSLNEDSKLVRIENATSSQDSNPN